MNPPTAYTKTAYLDCFSGISGDMMLGAIIDLGISADLLSERLKALHIKGFELQAQQVMRAGIRATKAEVIIKDPQNKAVYLKDIVSLINNSGLDEDIKERSLKVFKAIFTAEAKVHGEEPESVHLHELGGVDCMVDIVGTIIGLKELGIGQLLASPINLGSGFVKTSHGHLPVPAPATAELLKGYRVYNSNIPFELTTPTGAALVSSLSRQEQEAAFTIKGVGYGAGGKDLKEQPNVLRLFLNDSESSYYRDSIFVVTTNIDDMNPQYYESLILTLLKAGAKDAYLENLIMKKGRPGIKLTVLVDESNLQDIFDIVFTHTTSIGLRYHRVHRQMLHRRNIEVETKYGRVRLKAAGVEGAVINLTPEYEDMLALSQRHGIPLKAVEGEVTKAYIKRHDRD